MKPLTTQTQRHRKSAENKDVRTGAARRFTAAWVRASWNRPTRNASANRTCKGSLIFSVSLCLCGETIFYESVPNQSEWR